jgi:hypothetical protein
VIIVLLLFFLSSFLSLRWLSSYGCTRCLVIPFHDRQAGGWLTSWLVRKMFALACSADLNLVSRFQFKLQRCHRG